MPEIGERFIPQKEFKNGGWIGPIIPLVLLKCKELNPAAKLCWALLSNFAGDNGDCYPSYETLANNARISLRGAKKAIKELRNKGFIVWDKGGPGKSNRYYLLWHPIFEEWRREAEIRKMAKEEVEERCINPKVHILHPNKLIHHGGHSVHSA